MKSTSDLTHQASENLMRAVRELRTALGLSQTEFGRQLKKSLATIQRWEGIRPPDGEALVQLEQFARDQKHPELAQPFHAAAAVAIPSYTSFDLDVRPRDKTEAAHIAILLAAMRDEGSRDLLRKFEKLFEVPLQRLAEAIQAHEGKIEGPWHVSMSTSPTGDKSIGLHQISIDGIPEGAHGFAKTPEQIGRLLTPEQRRKLSRRPKP